MPILGFFIFFTGFGYWFFDRIANRVVSVSREPVTERASKLHEKCFVADLHADVCLWRRNHLKRNRRGHVDLPRLLEGNVALQFVTVPTKLVLTRRLPRFFLSDLFFWSAVMSLQRPSTWFNTAARVRLQLERVSNWIKMSQGSLQLIRTSDDLENIERIRQSGESLIGVMLGLEGAHVLRGDVNVPWLFEQGFRVVGITHFNDTQFGDSAHGLRRNGLTSDGHDLVKELDRHGIIIDLAHASEKLINDVLVMHKKGDLSRPPIVSHTGVKGTKNHRRNISDKQAIAIAKTGGIVGVTFFEPGLPRSSIAAVGEVVIYLVRLFEKAGLDGAHHIAFGSDFDGAVRTVIDSSGWSRIADSLLCAGLSEEDTRLVLGENVRRFFLNYLPRESLT